MLNLSSRRFKRKTFKLTHSKHTYNLNSKRKASVLIAKAGRPVRTTVCQVDKLIAAQRLSAERVLYRVRWLTPH